MVALRALPDVAADRERRARGVSLEDWLAAPAPPDTRDECEAPELELVTTVQGDEFVATKVTRVSARPCLALRCKFHLGRVGEQAGVSCYLDFIDDTAPDERTFVTIGRVLGVTKERAIELYNSGCHELESQGPEVLRTLGIRRRHA